AANTTLHLRNAARLPYTQRFRSITNPPSYTTVTVDDSADPVARTVTLDTYTSTSGVFGRISFGGVPIYYRYADTSIVTVYTGTDGRRLRNHAPRAPTPHHPDPGNTPDHNRN